MRTRSPPLARCLVHREVGGVEQGVDLRGGEVGHPGGEPDAAGGDDGYAGHQHRLLEPEPDLLGDDHRLVLIGAREQERHLSDPRDNDRVVGTEAAGDTGLGLVDQGVASRGAQGVAHAVQPVHPDRQQAEGRSAAGGLDDPFLEERPGARWPTRGLRGRVLPPTGEPGGDQQDGRSDRESGQNRRGRCGRDDDGDDAAAEPGCEGTAPHQHRLLRSCLASGSEAAEGLTSRAGLVQSRSRRVGGVGGFVQI